MSNTKNLANLASALDDGTSGQVLQSTGSGGVQFADSTGSGVTVHANQAAMLILMRLRLMRVRCITKLARISCM